MSSVIIMAGSNSGGGGGVNSIGWEGEVDYYSDLPDPSLHTGKVWLVRNDSGIWPFKKKAGFYISTGGTWKYITVTFNK